MGTKLNVCKAARKESRNADKHIESATIVTQIEEDGAHTIGFRTDKIDEALKACEKSIAKNEMVIDELEKNSKVKKDYIADIKKKENFIADFENRK